MHILMLTPSLPYPTHQGAAIRNFGLLRGLHAAGCTVTLLSFHDGSIDPASTPLADYCAQIVTVAPPLRSGTARLRDLALTRQPDLARRLESPLMRARLRDLLAAHSFDLVQFEGLEMAIYAEQVRTQQPTAKQVYDAHNAEFALQSVIARVDRAQPRRWHAAAYSLVQARRITRFERRIGQQVDAIVAVSDDDAAALRTLQPAARVSVVPNGIDVSAYQRGGDQLDLDEPVLVFTGKMDYRPNVDAMLWFTDAILPRVRAQFPAVKLVIVGQRPHPRLDPLRDDPHIEITGWVADVQPFVRAATVCVAPLRMGSGTRLKLLEALAGGSAVVATPIAASGLHDDVRRQMLLADTSATFADAIIRLLRDPARRRALSGAGQMAVAAHYDWSVLLPCLLESYREIGLG